MRIHHEREKTKFFESVNKWPQPLVLQSGTVNIIEISVRDELVTKETMQGLNNRLGKLLLPHSLTSQMRERIERNKHLPANVLCDQDGRVHQVVLANKDYLMMADNWSNVYQLKSLETEIIEFDRKTCTLKTVQQNSTRFSMPPQCREFLEKWIPSGIYLIEFDEEFHVFRIRQPPQVFGGNATDLQVGLKWDTRFYTDPPVLTEKPKLKRVPRIVPRFAGEVEGMMEEIKEIEIESFFDDSGMSII